MQVIIGVDPHKASHIAVAISAAEDELSYKRVPATRTQADQLLAWAKPFPTRVWAIEGADDMGYLLAQQLVATGEHMLNVPASLAARTRLLGTGRAFCNGRGRPAIWASRSGRGCEVDIVAARDLSTDCRDGCGAVIGCSPHVGHQRFERPEPQVIGAPPAHLLEQPRIDPCPDHRRRPQCILGLVVLGLGVGSVLGKVAFADACELERSLAGRTGFLDGVGGQLEQDLAGEGVVLRVQRHEAPGELAELHIVGDTRQRHPDRLGPILGRGPVLLRHAHDRTWAGRHTIGRMTQAQTRR
jgi:hypothetical protein